MGVPEIAAGLRPEGGDEVEGGCNGMEQEGRRVEMEQEGEVEEGEISEVRKESTPEFIREAGKIVDRIDGEASRKKSTGLARTTEEDGGEEFVASSVAYGDGSVGKSGIRLEVGKHYNSGARKGGHESFHEIDIWSLKLRTRGSRAGGSWTFYPVNRTLNVGAIEGPDKALIPKKKKKNTRWMQKQLLDAAMLNYADHCVVVDADRKLILDSASNYPVVLSEGNLARCGGDDATRVRVSEVREAIDQTVRTRN